MLQAKDALAVASGTGEARWWFGMLAEIKATAADTGGLFTLVEVTCGAGYEAPLHVHHREDEGFWVLDGQVTFMVGATTIDAGAGDYAFGPRGMPHRFTAESPTEMERVICEVEPEKPSVAAGNRRLAGISTTSS